MESKVIGFIKKTYFEPSFDELIKKLEGKSCKEIQMEIKGTDIAPLPNGNIMISCYDTGTIFLYDKDFKLIKKIKKINGHSFLCLSSTTNNLDKVFIADALNHRIIMTNLDFEFIDSCNVNLPHGLCFNEYLYTCIEPESKIYKHDKNLEFIQSYDLILHPYQIKVNDETAIVSNASWIKIFDAKTLTNCIAEIKTNCSSNIHLCKNYFLTTYNRDLCIYNLKGEMKKKIANVTDKDHNSYHGLAIIANQLILTNRKGVLRVFNLV